MMLPNFAIPSLHPAKIHWKWNISYSWGFLPKSGLFLGSIVQSRAKVCRQGGRWGMDIYNKAILVVPKTTDSFHLVPSEPYLWNTETYNPVSQAIPSRDLPPPQNTARKKVPLPHCTRPNDIFLSVAPGNIFLTQEQPLSTYYT